MKKKIRYTILLMLVPFFAISQKISYSLSEIPVTDLHNRITRLDTPGNKTFIIVVLGSDCPISQKYIPTLNDLEKSFQDEVTIIGIFPSHFSMEEVKTFRDEYALKFSCFIDHDMQVIDHLRAKVTPEVFLFTPDMKLQYSGAIDNWFYELGKYRAEVTHHYLKDAVVSVRDGKKIPIAKTEAIGCLIQQTKKPGKSHHMHH